jgi:hypothetical protein
MFSNRRKTAHADTLANSVSNMNLSYIKNLLITITYGIKTLLAQALLYVPLDEAFLGFGVNLAVFCTEHYRPCGSLPSTLPTQQKLNINTTKTQQKRNR